MGRRSTKIPYGLSWWDARKLLDFTSVGEFTPVGWVNLAILVYWFIMARIDLDWVCKIMAEVSREYGRNVVVRIDTPALS